MRTDQSVRDLTEKHRYARSVGDEQGASRYKKMMTSFGVAARFEGGRQQKHIVELTGLSLVDLDHIPSERMAEVLEKVRSDEHTLLAYTTISGEGVRVIARYALNENVNDNCYPLRTMCSSPLKRDSAESTEYRTNQKELSPFKGRSEAFRGLAKCQAVPSEGSAVLCATEADRERRERSDGAEGVKQCAEQYCVCGHKGRPTQYELQDIPLSKELLEHLGFRFDEADYKIKWWKCYSALSRENTSPFSTFAR